MCLGPVHCIQRQCLTIECGNKEVACPQSEVTHTPTACLLFCNRPASVPYLNCCSILGLLLESRSPSPLAWHLTTVYLHVLQVSGPSATGPSKYVVSKGGDDFAHGIEADLREAEFSVTLITWWRRTENTSSIHWSMVQPPLPPLGSEMAPPFFSFSPFPPLLLLPFRASN